MLTAEITGEKHPKKVVLVSDDADAENILLQESLEEWDFTDLARILNETKVDSDGKLKLEIPTDEIGEIMDLLEAVFFGSEAQKALEAMRQDAFDQAEAALAEDDD